MNRFVLALVAIIALIALAPVAEAGSFLTFGQFGNPVVVNAGFGFNNVRTLAVEDHFGNVDVVDIPISGTRFHTVGFNGSCNSGFRGRGNVTINNFNSGSRNFRPQRLTALGAGIQAFRDQKFGQR